MKRWLAVWSLLALWALVAGCSLHGFNFPPPPKPTPTPTPAPTQPPIPDGGHDCVKEGLTADCWHWPAGAVGWVYIPAAPPVTPPPVEASYLDGSRLVVKPGDMRPTMWGSVALAVERDKAAKAEAWELRAGAWCLASRADAVPAAMMRVSVQLAASQIKAGQIRWRDGKLSDSLGVVRPGTTEVEEYHLFEWGGGCVATNEHSLDAVDWEEGSAPPGPPPATSCAGIPRVHSFWADGKAATHWCDGTPLAPGVEGTDWQGVLVRDWCATVGASRQRCPYGDEGTVERVRREACGLGGDGLAVWHSDGEVFVVAENPLHLQASCSGCTWLELCGHDGTTGCTRCEWR